MVALGKNSFLRGKSSKTTEKVINFKKWEKVEKSFNSSKNRYQKNKTKNKKNAIYLY